MRKIINRWKMNCFSELYVLLGIAAIGWFFGVILVFIMYYFTNGFAAESCVTLGSIIAISIIAWFYVFDGMFGLAQNFALEISLGNTRKEFYLSYIVRKIINMAIVLMASGILMVLEELIQKYILKITDTFHSLSFFLDLRFLAVMLFVVPTAAMFFGILFLKFQRKAFWCMWLIWLFSFIILPKILSDKTKILTKWITQIIKFILNMPFLLHIVGIIIVSLAFAAADRILLRKQAV